MAAAQEDLVAIPKLPRLPRLQILAVHGHPRTIRQPLDAHGASALPGLAQTATNQAPQMAV